MAVTILRASMHPWVWWMIVKRAVEAHTKGQDCSMVLRRKAADFLKAFDGDLDPDDIEGVAYPYITMGAKARERAERRNAEILAKDPEYGRLQGQTVDSRTGSVLPGYTPIPNPLMRASVEITEAIRDFALEAVEAYAKEKDLGNEISRAFVDAVDALRAAEAVDPALALAREAKKA